jgi:hypothetical protein
VAALLEWLAGDNARLQAEVDRLTAENQRRQARVAELTCQVEELRRAARRQAAPFSKERPAANPRRPGRKPGAGYGRHGRRPTPQRVDRVVAVGLPDACPGCGGELVVERIACQYQEDLPPRSSVIILFRVPIGRCGGCGRRVQPRHPEQTSPALGAAAVQLGPVSPTRRTPPPEVRYHIIVAELVGGHATVVMDATGAGFHAAVGDYDGDHLLVEHGVGGDPHLLEHLAELIAHHPTGRHRRTQ